MPTSSCIFLLYFVLVDPVIVDEQQKEEPRVVVSNTQDAYMGDDEEITIEVRAFTAVAIIY